MTTKATSRVIAVINPAYRLTLVLNIILPSEKYRPIRLCLQIIV